MKLNLDYYQKDIEYNKSKNEGILISKYLKKQEESNYNEIMNQDMSVEEMKALSDIRKNIVRWYPFKKNASILEIGAHLGEITGELCKKANKVISIESSKKRAEMIEKRYIDQENLELIVGEMFEISLQEKFDYITLVYVLEYAKELNVEPEEMIQHIKQFLKPNGRILIVTDNKFGMRSFANIQKNTNNKRFEAISSSENKLLTKEKLNQIINKENFSYIKYYYVLPDANFANVIFTDKFLPNHDSITRNITIFDDDELINFHENNAYQNVIKDNPNMFPYFANTFFIEIGNTEEENEIQYVSFGNLRKPKYRMQTVIKKEHVYKQSIEDKSHWERMKRNIDHMNQLNIKTLDCYDERQIISKYVKNGQTVDKVLLSIYKEKGIEKVKEFINLFFEEIQKKLTKVDGSNNVFDKYQIDCSNYPIEKLHFVKEGLWDLTFQNCFYIENEFYFYDQEWFEENIPIEFIMYRNILYFHELKQNMVEEDWYRELNILEYKELFQILDNKLQEEIRDDLIWKRNIKPMENIQAIINNNENLKHQWKLEQKKKEEWEREKKVLLEQLQGKDAELYAIYNSRSWKAISKIRNIINR